MAWRRRNPLGGVSHGEGAGTHGLWAGVTGGGTFPATGTLTGVEASV
jgi:hypothetical protein